MLLRIQYSQNILTEKKAEDFLASVYKTYKHLNYSNQFFGQLTFDNDTQFNEKS